LKERLTVAIIAVYVLPQYAELHFLCHKRYNWAIKYERQQ